MRKLIKISIILLFVAFDLNTNDCECDDIDYKIVNCDTTFFETDTYLFWQYNCDSSWLSFKDIKGNNRILTSFVGQETMVFTNRIGLNFIAEYPDYLLFINEWISGCCDPMDHIFLDKMKGQEIKKIDRDYFIYAYKNYNDHKNDYVVYFDEFYTKINLLKLYSNKIQSRDFDPIDMELSADIQKPVRINDIFDIRESQDSTLILKYPLIESNSNDQYFKYIKFDLTQ